MKLRIGTYLAAVLSPFYSGAEECAQPLDRPFTLSGLRPYLVEWAQERMAAGEEPLGFILPEPLGADCAELPSPSLAYRGDSGREQAGILFLAGQEFRYLDDGVFATELGGAASGRKGLVSFHLEARTYAELGDGRGRPSFDREDVDEQSEEVTGASDYRSYSRFRGDLNLATPFGRFTAARDAAHWGPGLHGNLTFSQEAVPFYQYVFASRIGPLKLASLYGDLTIGRSQASSAENENSRDLYAHRYELSLGQNWLLGLTEQLILFEMSKPYLFAPIFPLFIAKGFMMEDRTNGNIAVDLSWRTPLLAMVFGEFLLDDLESPASLFTKAYSQNKWAARLGFHWTRTVGSASIGIISEYVQVEPWVYSHFQPSTAQAANLGYPLGTPFGPDSRSLVGKAYARFASGFYSGGKAVLTWKGRGSGSSLEDPTPFDPLTRKEWPPGGGGVPDFTFEPDFSYSGRHVHAYAGCSVGSNVGFRAGAQVFY